MDHATLTRLLRTIDAAAGHPPMHEIENRLHSLQVALAELAHRPTVLALSSVNPVAIAPPHVRDMVLLAGGQPLPPDGYEFAPETLDDVIQTQPECVLFVPATGTIGDAIDAFAPAAAHEAWRDIPASYLNQIICVAAGHGFERPDGRVADGIEVLAGLLHPNRVPHPSAERAMRVQPFALDL